MRPRKDDETLVDVLDVLLRDGAILRADVIVSVADIPLIGIKLTAAIAGMETMQEYGLFEQWDLEHRRNAVTRRGHKKDRSRAPDELERLTVGTTPDGVRSRTEEQSSTEDRSRGDDRRGNDENGTAESDGDADGGDDSDVDGDGDGDGDAAGDGAPPREDADSDSGSD